MGSGEPMKASASVALAVAIGGSIWSGNVIGAVVIGLVAGTLAYAIVR
jgi:hypothetical protein